MSVCEVATHLESLATRGNCIREAAASAPASLPVRTGPSANPGVFILKSDAFLELGCPGAGSCGIALCTSAQSLVTDGRIRWSGPDIPEAAAAELPFGQVVLVAGEGLCGEDYPVLTRSLLVTDQIEGYMLRSTGQHLWARVSREAVGKGFNFAVLGSALIQLVRGALPSATAVEVIFITSARADLARLTEMAAGIAKIGHELEGLYWKGRGVDISECSKVGHCGSCSDRQACDSIRKIITVKHAADASANTGGAGNTLR